MPKHNRGGPGQLRAHSRSSSATRLGANLQFTQPGAAGANQAPGKLVRRASGYGEQTTTTRAAPPLARAQSSQRVQSREQLAKRLAPLHTQRPPSRQAKSDAAAKKAYEAQRKIVQDEEDDDDEWESSVESATPDQDGSGSDTASEDETDQAILKNLNLQQQGPTRETQHDFDQQMLQQEQMREYERQQQQARLEQEQREQYMMQQQYQHEQIHRQRQQLEHQRMLQMQQQQQQQGGGQMRYEDQLALQQQYERQYLAQQKHQQMLHQQQMQQLQAQAQQQGGQLRYEDQQALQREYEERKFLEQQHLNRLRQQQLQQQQHYQQQQHLQQQQQHVRQPQPIRQTDFIIPKEADHVSRTTSAQKEPEQQPAREAATTPRPTTPRQASRQNVQQQQQQKEKEKEQASEQQQQQQQPSRRSQQSLQTKDRGKAPARETTTPPPRDNGKVASEKSPVSPTPTASAKSVANSQRSPRPGHLKSRPPSMHSITSTRTDHVRPHPLFRGLSHGPPRTAPLAPLTVVPTSTTELPLSRSPESSATSARQFLSSSPTSQRMRSNGSPASAVVSVADLTHPFASQSTANMSTSGKDSKNGRRTSVSGASIRSAATTATNSVFNLPAHLMSVHAGILAGPHERARTMSSMSAASSSAALSSLTNLPTTTRPPSPQTIAFFPPTNPHANLDAIHPLLPPPYLANHLTILARRTPLRESFDRVIRAKNAAAAAVAPAAAAK